LTEVSINEIEKETKITTMGWPRCPKCKSYLDTTDDDPIMKPYKCTNPNCDTYFEKDEVLSGWMTQNFLKKGFKEKIWKLIIEEVKKNHEIDIQNTQNRIEVASKCKHYCHKCNEAFRCKNPEATFVDDDGTSGCYLAGSWPPPECYEKV
jgi:hypothetical protein